MADKLITHSQTSQLSSIRKYSNYTSDDDFIQPTSLRIASSTLYKEFDA